MGWFVEMCRRRGLKVNAGKSKVMVLGGAKGLKCEVCVDGIRYSMSRNSNILDESDKEGAECSRKVASGLRVGGVIRSLVNARDSQLECARVLQETFLLPVFIYVMEGGEI